MIRLLSITFLLFSLLVGCSDSGGDDAPAQAFAIAYFVESTGGAATVTQIDYTNSSGATVTVMNPVLPWTVTANRTSGESARLVVTGSTGASSTITGRIQDDPALVMMPTTYASTTCPENTNPCMIDIMHAF